MSRKSKIPIQPFFPEQSSPFWLSSKAAVGFLLAVTVLLFGRFLSPSSQQVLSRPCDLSSQFIWWRQFGFEELKKGHLVLWNPHLFCGTPFFGGFQSALLYPLNWLYMVLPMAFAMNLIIALHVFLAGWFTFLWIRKRGSHPASALLAALMYMFSGAFFVKIIVGHLTNLCTMAWIPLVFLAIDAYRDDRRMRWIGLGAFAITMQIFSGHVQYVYYTVMASAFYVLFTLRRSDKKAFFLSGFILMYMGGAFLSAVQLLAGWNAVKESVRANGLSIDILDMLNMNPERLYCLFMPNFFGSWKDYWGGGNYCDGHPFVSLTGFVLALFALKVSSHPDKKFFSSLGLFLTILMLGTRTPLFIFFCKYFPLFGSFRGVSKLNIIVVVCLAALTAMALDEIFKSPKVLTGLAKATGWGGMVFGLIASAFFIVPRLGGARLFKQFVSHADEMAFHLLLAGALLAGLSLLAYAGCRWKALRWGFLVFALVELLAFANENLSTFNLLDLRADTANVIQQTYDQDPGNYRVWVERGNYTLGTSGLDIWGEDPLVLYRYGLFACDTQHFDFNNDILRTRFFYQISPPLGLLRLRYIFRFEGDKLVAQRSGLKEIPRAFLVSRWQKSSLESIMAQVISPSFNPLRKVWLEKDPGFENDSSSVRGQVTLKDISTDAIEIHAQTSKPAVLVLSDNYSNGWKAVGYQDSAESSYSILPANGFMRAILLPAGFHHILLEYRPEAFVIGAWISGISWVVFAGCFFLMVPLRRRR